VLAGLIELLCKSTQLHTLNLQCARSVARAAPAGGDEANRAARALVFPSRATSSPFRSDTYLFDAGARALAGALRASGSLKHLNVRCVSACRRLSAPGDADGSMPLQRALGERG
jgi:hypothetical protein